MPLKYPLTLPFNNE